MLMLDVVDLNHRPRTLKVLQIELRIFSFGRSSWQEGAVGNWWRSGGQQERFPGFVPVAVEFGGPED